MEDHHSHTIHDHPLDPPHDALHHNEASPSGEDAFCQGMPMTMYMEGFQWALWRRPSQQGEDATTTPSLEDDVKADSSTKTPLPPCLVYLVPTWMLDTRGSFEGAVVFSFWLAFLLEVLSALRDHVLRMHHGLLRMKLPTNQQHQPQPHQQREEQHDEHEPLLESVVTPQESERTTTTRRRRRIVDAVEPTSPSLVNATTATTSDNNTRNHNRHLQSSHQFRIRRLLVSCTLTLIYGLQALLGYLLMFMAMSFSLEILGATVLGLMVGNLVLFRYHEFAPRTKRQPPQQQQQPQEENHSILHGSPARNR